MQHEGPGSAQAEALGPAPSRTYRVEFIGDLQELLVHLQANLFALEDRRTSVRQGTGWAGAGVWVGERQALTLTMPTHDSDPSW